MICSARPKMARTLPVAARAPPRRELRAELGVPRVPLGVPRKRAARTSVRSRPARCAGEKSRAHQRPLASRRVVLGAVSRQSGARRELVGVVHTLRTGTRRTRAPPSYTGAMKLLHRPDLYAWSRFDEARNIDFHSVLWVREGGNVVIDPLPLSTHEQARLASLGGVRHLLITNSDHVRAARAVADATGARLYGPVAERDRFPIPCDAWLADGDEPVPGLTVHALSGSKTPGELAFVLERSTLITGDLIRAHAGGRLTLLPDAKLTDRAAALQSVKRLAALPEIDAVLVGDGWPVFRQGKAILTELVQELERAESE